MKTHRQQLTGEMAYLEHKRESFTLEHPDYDEEEVEAKLKRKYKKLSDKRKVQKNLENKNKNAVIPVLGNHSNIDKTKT